MYIVLVLSEIPKAYVDLYEYLISKVISPFIYPIYTLLNQYFFISYIFNYS